MRYSRRVPNRVIEHPFEANFLAPYLLIHPSATSALPFYKTHKTASANSLLSFDSSSDPEIPQDGVYSPSWPSLTADLGVGIITSCDVCFVTRHLLPLQIGRSFSLAEVDCAGKGPVAVAGSKDLIMCARNGCDSGVLGETWDGDREDFSGAGGNWGSWCKAQRSGAKDRTEAALTDMANVRAQLPVAYKRFSDNIPLAIDHELVRGVERDILQALSTGLGINTPDGLCISAELAHESPKVSARREELLEKLSRMSAASHELHQIGRKG